MRWLCWILNLLIIIPAAAQDRKGFESKMSPLLLKPASLQNDDERKFLVSANNLDSLRETLKGAGYDGAIISEYHPSQVMVLRLKQKIVDSLIFPSRYVNFVDLVRIPKEETVIDGFDLSSNKLNLVHHRHKEVTGEGLVISVKESKPDTNDIDFTGRFLQTTAASSITTSHATIMATIIAGGGNTYFTGRGAAWAASISSSDFTNLLPNTDQFYKQYAISVQNHSYGTGIENYYGADAEAYDASTITNPSLVHVFSAGNSGDKTSTSGIYSGKALFANLTGSFKMAKNIITVGAVDSFGMVAPLSSRGPAYDGRLRPEIVAFAQDGTSGATALVSGTALLLQHAYKPMNAGVLPSSALIKSVLLNSANDIGSPGIDFQSGFGNLDAFKAMQTILNKHYFSGSLRQNETKSHTLEIPSNISRLKITICWNDVPANANDAKSLVNDLDMRLLDPVTGQNWQPWVLNSHPHVDSLTLLPTRKRDSLNNVEYISIENPVAGPYLVEIKGYKVTSGAQAYYVSYQLDSANRFSWDYPTANDILLSGVNNAVRWTSSFPGNVGLLYYSVDAGTNWNLVSKNVDLGKKFFNWITPDNISNIQFRMVIADRNFDSDTSMISTRLLTNVGFNCSDSFSILWNSQPAMRSYTVYQLGKKYMEPILTTSDTAIILSKSDYPATQYAIAANIAGRPGIRSYAFNYNTQGIGCYIKNFIVDLSSSNSGAIQVELGTTYNITGLLVEKAYPGGFQAIETISNASTLKYEFTDPNLLKGSNTYRVRINLADGKVIYSEPETIFYLPGTSFLIYPNPAKWDFKIFSRDTDNADLIIYNSIGQRVFVGKINSSLQTFQVPHLKRGLHFIIIMQSNKKIYQGSLVLQ